MPAIGPEPTRRALLGILAAAMAGAAGAADEAWDVVSAMASALGRGSDSEFLAACDSSMPGYAALRGNLAALVASADVESSIDPVKNEGNDTARDLEVDWEMRLVDRSGLQRLTRRREIVKCRLERQARKWKVVRLDPAGFFAPPSARMDLADERRARAFLR